MVFDERYMPLLR
jgi:hypothetical protein